jgi:hypothetical protein
VVKPGLGATASKQHEYNRCLSAERADHDQGTVDGCVP